jgi:hypothetical protein
MAASKQIFVGIHSASLLPLLLFLFVGLIGLIRLYRNRFRLNKDFGKGFRCDTFGFSALFPVLSLYRSLLLALSLCHFSLPTEWRLRRRLSTEYIRLLCSLSVYFSLSVSSVSSDCVAFASFSLSTEWRLRSRARWNPIGFEREKCERQCVLLADFLELCHWVSGHSAAARYSFVAKQVNCNYY